MLRCGGGLVGAGGRPHRALRPRGDSLARHLASRTTVRSSHTPVSSLSLRSTPELRNTRSGTGTTTRAQTHPSCIKPNEHKRRGAHPAVAVATAAIQYIARFPPAAAAIMMESETGEQQRQADIAQTKHCLNSSGCIVDHAFFLIQRFPSFHLIPTQSSFCSGGPAGCQRPTWILSPASTLSPSAATLAANCVVLPRGAVRANRTEQRGFNSWQESGAIVGARSHRILTSALLQTGFVACSKDQALHARRHNVSALKLGTKVFPAVELAGFQLVFNTDAAIARRMQLILILSDEALGLCWRRFLSCLSVICAALDAGTGSKSRSCRAGNSSADEQRKRVTPPEGAMRWRFDHEATLPGGGEAHRQHIQC